MNRRISRFSSFTSWALLLLGGIACTSPKPPALTPTATAVPVCYTAERIVAFPLVDAAATKKAYPSPTVRLLGTNETAEVVAAWEGTKLNLTVPAGLTFGQYEVTIRDKRRPANAVQTLGTIRVVGVPRVTKVRGAAVCVQSTQPESVDVIGERLDDSSVVTLDGLAGVELERTVNADGSLRVVIPTSRLEKGRVYPIVVSNAPGCSAREPNGVITVDAPSPVLFTVGPTLQDGTTVPPGTPMHLRISGSQVVSGSRVFVDDTEATSVRETDADGVIVAEVPSVAAGPHTVRVANGSCSVNVPGVLNVSGALPITLQAANPNSVTTYGNHYIDLSTVFAGSVEANVFVRFFIDLNPDPFTAVWEPLSVDAELNGNRTLYRLHTPPLALPSSQNLDVRAEVATVVDGPAVAGVEGFLPGGLFVWRAEALPVSVIPRDVPMRLVAKDKDHAVAGEKVVLYGCFSDDVSVQLVAMDGVHGSLAQPVVATLPVGANLTAEPWAAAKYRCVREQADSVTRMLEVTVPADLAPGAYRFRLASLREVGAGVEPRELVADDLYPFVVYGASPSLGAFSFAQNPSGTALQLSVGRKLAASATLTDGSGRKWVYVVGGDASGIVSSSPLPVGAVSTSYDYSAVSSSHTLLGFSSASLAASASDVGNIAATYGMLALADGPSLYLVGGTSNGTAGGTTAEIRRSRVVEPLIDGASATAGSLAPFTRVGQMQTAGSTPLPSYGHSGAILRRGSVGEFARSVVVVRGVPDKDTNFLADNVVTSSTLSDAGFSNLDVVTSLDSSARGQAFGAAFQPAADELNIALGYAAPADDSIDTSTGSFQNAASNFHTTQRLTLGPTLERASQALSGSLDVVPGQTVSLFAPEVGAIATSAATGAFLIGGVVVQYNNSNNDDSFQFSELRFATAEPQDRVRSLSGTQVTAAASKLVERRAYMSMTTLNPHLYIFGGIVCPGDDTSPNNDGVCDDTRNISENVEVARFGP